MGVRSDAVGIEAVYTNLIQQYLEVLCFDNATFLAERMVADLSSSSRGGAPARAIYLLAMCHYRSSSPKRARSVLLLHGGRMMEGRRDHEDEEESVVVNAMTYLLAKCCVDLKLYGEAEEHLLRNCRMRYQQQVQKSSRTRPSASPEGRASSLRAARASMDEWILTSTPCPVPCGAVGLHLLGTICRRTNRRRRAADYHRLALRLDPFLWTSFEALCELGSAATTAAAELSPLGLPTVPTDHPTRFFGCSGRAASLAPARTNRELPSASALRSVPSASFRPSQQRDATSLAASALQTPGVEDSLSLSPFLAHDASTNARRRAGASRDRLAHVTSSAGSSNPYTPVSRFPSAASAFHLRASVGFSSPELTPIPGDGALTEFLHGGQSPHAAGGRPPGSAAISSVGGASTFSSIARAAAGHAQDLSQALGTLDTVNRSARRLDPEDDQVIFSRARQVAARLYYEPSPEVTPIASLHGKAKMASGVDRSATRAETALPVSLTGSTRRRLEGLTLLPTRPHPNEGTAGKDVASTGVSNTKEEDDDDDEDDEDEEDIAASLDTVSNDNAPGVVRTRLAQSRLSFSSSSAESPEVRAATQEGTPSAKTEKGGVQTPSALNVSCESVEPNVTQQTPSSTDAVDGRTPPTSGARLVATKGKKANQLPNFRQSLEGVFAAIKEEGNDSSGKSLPRVEVELTDGGGGDDFSKLDQTSFENDNASSKTSDADRTLSKPVDGDEDQRAILEILDVLRILGEGYRLLCMYQCQEALNTFEQLPSNHLSTGWVQHQIGRAHFEIGQYKQAQLALETMQRVEPHRMKGLEVLSTTLWHLKKEVELSHLAQLAVGFDRMAPEAWCVVGNCFSLHKEHETALTFFRRSIQIDSSFTYAHTLSGHEYVANEDFDKAVACYRDAIRSDERHYNAWYGLGAIYYRQEKYELAEYHFKRATLINPCSPVLYCHLGIAQHASGKPFEALEVLSRVFEISPRNAQARYQRATIWMSLDRPEEALVELQHVRDAAPREASVHFALGRVLKRLGQTREAMRCFLTALDLDPKDNNHIKAALEKLDDPDVDEEVSAF